MVIYLVMYLPEYNRNMPELVPLRFWIGNNKSFNKILDKSYIVARNSKDMGLQQRI